MILTAHEMEQCLDQDTISSLHHTVSLEKHCEFLQYLATNIEEHWKELAKQLNVNWLKRADRCFNAPKSACCLEVGLHVSLYMCVCVCVCVFVCACV